MHKTILIFYGFFWLAGVINYFFLRYLIASRKMTDVPTRRGFHKFIFSPKIRDAGGSLFYWSCLSYRWLAILFIIVFFVTMFIEIAGFGLTKRV